MGDYIGPLSGKPKVQNEAMILLKGCKTICESMDVFPTKERDLVVLQLREYIEKRQVYMGLWVNRAVKVILTTNQCCAVVEIRKICVNGENKNSRSAASERNS